jgi:hypothetical protein
MKLTGEAFKEKMAKAKAAKKAERDNVTKPESNTPHVRIQVEEVAPNDGILNGDILTGKLF